MAGHTMAPNGTVSTGTVVPKGKREWWTLLGVRAKRTEVIAAEARIRARLRAYMETRDISISELARRLGVSSSNLTRMLHGGRGMSVGFLMAARRVLSVSADLLLDEPARPERSKHSESVN